MLTSAYQKSCQVMSAIKSELSSRPKLTVGLCWLAGVVGLIVGATWLQGIFGERFEYPKPDFFRPAGVAYLALSLVVALALSSKTATSRFATPWIVISLVAGVCFYPFLFSAQSFVTTNFLSADWAYPFSQVQPPAKLVNPEPHDSFMMYYPFKYFWTETVRHLSFPLWDFARNGGMPFAANTLTGVYYPLNLVFLLCGVETGWGWIGLIHLLVGGVGMYLLVDRITQCRFAALYGGVSFMLMPLLAGWSRGVVWNSTGVWLPLVCYFLLRAVTEQNVRSACLAALTLAVAVLGGWIQWAIYFYLLLGLVALQWVTIEFYRRRTKAAAVAGIVFAGVLALSLALAIIHLGPFREVTTLQPRSPVPWNQVQTMQPPFGLLANLAYFVPTLFGSHVDGGMAPGWSFLEYQRYLGVLCFPLATLAFVSRRTLRVALFILVPCLFFLSVSRLGIAYKLLYHVIPGFDAIPSQQTRVLFIVEFLILLLAALGASNLRSLVTAPRQPVTTVLLSWAMAYLGFALIILQLRQDGGIPDTLRAAGVIRSITFASVFVLSGLTLGLCPMAMRNARAFVALLQFLVAAACIGELVLQHHKIASFSRPLVATIPHIVEEIKAGGDGRIFRTGGLPVTYAFIQNSAALIYGINDTMLHDSVYLTNYAKFFSLFNPTSDYRNPHAMLPLGALTADNVELVRMLNTDYVFHRESIDGTQVNATTFDRSLVDYVRQEDERHILRLKNPKPRAFFVHQARVVSESEARQALGNRNFKADETAYLTAGDTLASLPPVPLPGNDDPASVTYAQCGPNAFALHYQSKIPRLVFISNVMYPGWTAATRDGQTLPIYEANLAFMLVSVPAAQDGEIVFHYRPTHFSLYLLISTIALLAVIFGVVRTRYLHDRLASVLPMLKDHPSNLLNPSP